ncbi:WD40/YVTN/BNR-like repeat-containing protein [Aequorivita capsosiphonis]|uniref:WD40/YVTN/BNR-like repeat-containing protein n=1 Tax=Aequorivita capsosiphonis TaxID=487317 RepID=UPI00040D4CA2|nr:YCF48-related protein [Aequorivita capsosiphonis]
MKALLLISIYLFCNFGFSQESWGYLPIEITDNSHGAIYTIDENIVHVVSDSGIFYKTEDGGETWTSFESGVSVYFLDLVFDGIEKGYAVGKEGKILKTSNAGQSWSELTSGTSEALISIAINAASSIWAVGNNGTILHSTDNGNSWTLNNSVTSEALNSVKFKDENIGYIAGNNGVLFYTENGGANWEQLIIPNAYDLFSISITDNYVYLLNGYTDNDYFSRSASQLLKTGNNTDWTVYYIDDAIGSLGNADLFFRDDNTGFSLNSAAMLCDCCNVWIVKTSNGGENWDFSLNEETNAANCHANDTSYAEIIFPTENIGYALIGRFILKTPYDTASIEDFNTNRAFTIYPNPSTNGKFNLKINSTNTEELLLEIVDITGKIIFSENDLKENNSISLPNISEGIYFVRLMKDEKMVATKKLIKG